VSRSWPWRRGRPEQGQPEQGQPEQNQPEQNQPEQGRGSGAVAPEDLLSRLDSLVEPAAEPENAVLTDDTRAVRWAGPLFTLFAVIMVPWTVYIGESLPMRQLSSHYDASWAGFDVLLVAALAGTGYFALRRSRYLAMAATATAVLLIVDAWFDLMTTPEGQIVQSIVLAAVVELPLAAVCIWLGLHTQELSERRIVLLMRRRGGASGLGPR